jgi:hypothetical protein
VSAQPAVKRREFESTLIGEFEPGFREVLMRLRLEEVPAVEDVPQPHRMDGIAEPVELHLARTRVPNRRGAEVTASFFERDMFFQQCVDRAVYRQCGQFHAVEVGHGSKSGRIVPGPTIVLGSRRLPCVGRRPDRYEMFATVACGACFADQNVRVREKRDHLISAEVSEGLTPVRLCVGEFRESGTMAPVTQGSGRIATDRIYAECPPAPLSTA